MAACGLLAIPCPPTYAPISSRPQASSLGPVRNCQETPRSRALATPAPPENALTPVLHGLRGNSLPHCIGSSFPAASTGKDGARTRVCPRLSPKPGFCAATPTCSLRTPLDDGQGTEGSPEAEAAECPPAGGTMVSDWGIGTPGSRTPTLYSCEAKPYKRSLLNTPQRAGGKVGLEGVPPPE